MRASSPSQRVAIAGLGAIGAKVALALDEGMEGLSLAAVSGRDSAKTAAVVAQLRHPVPVAPVDSLATYADIVVECAPPQAFAQIAIPVLKAGKSLVVLSVGALSRDPAIQECAREFGGTILVPSGALVGLDAVLAAAEGKIHSVRLVTRKAPVSLAGAPYLKDRTDIASISVPERVFVGSAREGAAGFPANVNVAAALSLAGVGLDETMLEIWADPTITTNIHHVEIHSDSGRVSMTIENIPSENPRTSAIAARSVIALLRKLAGTTRIGT